MRLNRCDICRQQITNPNEQIVLGYGIPELQYSFCPICAKPVIAFLKRHRLPSFPAAHQVEWPLPSTET
jgi:hypothetical protein